MSSPGPLCPAGAPVAAEASGTRPGGTFRGEDALVPQPVLTPEWRFRKIALTNRCSFMPNETRNPLARSFQIIRYLLRSEDEAVGVRRMAADMKMAPSSIHRLLTALVEEGLVEKHDDTGLYSLGLEMIRLAHQAAARRPLHKLAIPYLRELVGASNETALLGMYDHSRQEMMFVAVVESTQPLRYVNKMWEWMPVYAGASGLAIMAFLSEAEQQDIINRTRLAPITDRTITERYKLEHQFEQIRKRGYASSIGQRTHGAVAIAAPIFGPIGDVIGDAIITVPEQRFDPASEAHLAEHVMRCANNITRQLGGRRPEQRRATVEETA